MEELLKIEQILLLAKTDNKSLDEVSNSSTATSDLLYQVEIDSINLKCVEGNKQIGDCLTKKGASPACLLNVLKSAQFQNYIYRYQFMDTFTSIQTKLHSSLPIHGYCHVYPNKITFIVTNSWILSQLS